MLIMGIVMLWFGCRLDVGGKGNPALGLGQMTEQYNAVRARTIGPSPLRTHLSPGSPRCELVRLLVTGGVRVDVHRVKVSDRRL